MPEPLTPSVKRGLTLSGIRWPSFQHGDETWLLWSDGKTHKVEQIKGHWKAQELGLVVKS